MRWSPFLKGKSCNTTDISAHDDDHCRRERVTADLGRDAGKIEEGMASLALDGRSM